MQIQLLNLLAIDMAGQKLGESFKTVNWTDYECHICAKMLSFRCCLLQGWRWFDKGLLDPNQLPVVLAKAIDSQETAQIWQASK